MCVRVFARLLFVIILTSTFAPVSAQNYPSKVIRIVTAPPGSANDIGARLIAQGITNAAGQRAIVENRAGVTGIDAVAKAPPDGYTILFFGTGGVYYSGFFQSDINWDPEKDFAPITLGITSPNVLAVHPSLPVKTPTELVRLAKARPGALNYASGPMGVEPHLAMEMFKSMSKTDVVRVGYKGTGPSITALMAGEVQLMIANAGTVMPQARTGRLRALAVTSAKPSALAPELPTLDSFIPGYESGVFIGLWAPAKTSPSIISFLNREAAQALNRPETKKLLFDSGLETSGNSPEEFAAIMKSEFAKWSALIKSLDIRKE
jgi:tripartite-type tricarboxylate transporter receptor subunit TctC